MGVGSEGETRHQSFFCLDVWMIEQQVARRASVFGKTGSFQCQAEAELPQFNVWPF